MEGKGKIFRQLHELNDGFVTPNSWDSACRGSRRITGLIYRANGMLHPLLNLNPTYLGMGNAAGIGIYTATVKKVRRFGF